MTAVPRPEARVLVVDDEQYIRRVIGVLLTRFSTRYNVLIHEADSAEAAIAAIERDAYHLIVSDYSMPGKTGIDLLAIAYNRAPKTGRMLITALGQLDIGVEAINRGHVDAFMRKPWDNQAFLALVDSLLEPRVAVAQQRAAQLAPLPQPGASAAAPSDRARVEAELQDVERSLRQLRVRLGLGNISPDGYRRVADELNAKRAKLEIELLRLRA